LREIREVDRMNETYKLPEDHLDTEGQYEPGLYEIRIKGHLVDRWAARFEGMTLRLQDNGDTLLTGRVVDQAELHGLLRKVRDLGMPLLSVMRLKSGHAQAPDEQGAKH
jgi:hypothetical protein